MSLWYGQILQSLWTDGLTEIWNGNDLHKIAVVNKSERMVEHLTLNLVLRWMYSSLPLVSSQMKEYKTCSSEQITMKLHVEKFIQLVHPFPKYWGIIALVRLIVYSSFKQQKIWNS